MALLSDGGTSASSLAITDASQDRQFYRANHHPNRHPHIPLDPHVRLPFRFVGPPHHAPSSSSSNSSYPSGTYPSSGSTTGSTSYSTYAVTSATTTDPYTIGPYSSGSTTATSSTLPGPYSSTGTSSSYSTTTTGTSTTSSSSTAPSHPHGHFGQPIPWPQTANPGEVVNMRKYKSFAPTAAYVPPKWTTQAPDPPVEAREQHVWPASMFLYKPDRADASRNPINPQVYQGYQPDLTPRGLTADQIFATMRTTGGQHFQTDGPWGPMPAPNTRAMPVVDPYGGPHQGVDGFLANGSLLLTGFQKDKFGTVAAVYQDPLPPPQTGKYSIPRSQIGLANPQLRFLQGVDYENPNVKRHRKEATWQQYYDAKLPDDQPLQDAEIRRQQEMWAQRDLMWNRQGERPPPLTEETERARIFGETPYGYVGYHNMLRIQETPPPTQRDLKEMDPRRMMFGIPMMDVHNAPRFLVDERFKGADETRRQRNQDVNQLALPGNLAFRVDGTYMGTERQQQPTGVDDRMAAQRDATLQGQDPSVRQAPTTLTATETLAQRLAQGLAATAGNDSLRFGREKDVSRDLRVAVGGDGTFLADQSHQQHGWRRQGQQAVQDDQGVPQRDAVVQEPRNLLPDALVGAGRTHRDDTNLGDLLRRNQQRETTQGSGTRPGNETLLTGLGVVDRLGAPADPLRRLGATDREVTDLRATALVDALQTGGTRWDAAAGVDRRSQQREAEAFVDGGAWHGTQTRLLDYGRAQGQAAGGIGATMDDRVRQALLDVRDTARASHDTRLLDMGAVGQASGAVATLADRVRQAGLDVRQQQRPTHDTVLVTMGEAGATAAVQDALRRGDPTHERTHAPSRGGQQLSDMLAEAGRTQRPTTATPDGTRTQRDDGSFVDVLTSGFRGLATMLTGSGTAQATEQAREARRQGDVSRRTEVEERPSNMFQSHGFLPLGDVRPDANVNRDATKRAQQEDADPDSVAQHVAVPLRSVADGHQAAAAKAMARRQVAAAIATATATSTNAAPDADETAHAANDALAGNRGTVRDQGDRERLRQGAATGTDRQQRLHTTLPEPGLHVLAPKQNEPRFRSRRDDDQAGSTRAHAGLQGPPIPVGTGAAPPGGITEIMRRAMQARLERPRSAVDLDDTHRPDHISEAAMLPKARTVASSSDTAPPALPSSVVANYDVGNSLRGYPTQIWGPKKRVQAPSSEAAPPSSLVKFSWEA